MKAIHAGAFLAMLVALNASCRCHDPPSPANKVIQTLGDLPEPGEVLSDEWYRVEVRGQPGGVVRHTIHGFSADRGGGFLVHHQSRIALLRQGDRAEIATDTWSLEDRDGHLLRFRRERTQSGVLDRLEAGRVGDELLIVVNDEIRREPYREQTFALENLEWHLFRKGLQPGDRIVLRTFNPEVGGTCLTTIHVIEASSFGAHLQADSCAMPGSAIDLRLDSQGRILESIQALGRLSIRSVRAEGPLEVPRGVRLDELMSFRVQPPAGFPQNARRVRLRLSGLPENRPVALDAPGQRVVGQPAPGTVELELAAPPAPAMLPYPLPKVPPEIAPYLEPSAMVQSDQPEIVAAAREATRGSTDALAAVQRLAALVKERLRANMSQPNASALDAWRERSGDCSERALLFAALCRAAGIPARGAMGLVYTDRAFGSHMWNEVYLGDWVPVDAGLGGPPPLPTHLWLAADPLLPGVAPRETREAAGIIAGDLEIEFLRMEPLLPAESP